MLASSFEKHSQFQGNTPSMRLKIFKFFFTSRNFRLSVPFIVYLLDLPLAPCRRQVQAVQRRWQVVGVAVVVEVEVEAEVVCKLEEVVVVVEHRSEEAVGSTRCCSCKSVEIHPGVIYIR
jgi:hypothetical protein